MKKIKLSEIFKIFFKIGVILLGGGYVILPILNEELVKKRKWLTEEETCLFFTTSQCLPGVVAINTTILIGQHLRKLKGAIVAVFALCLSPVITIIFIAKLINLITSIPIIESIVYGINISVIILIYLTLKDMWKKSFTDVFTYFWFILILFLVFLKINPMTLIIFSILFAILSQFIKEIISNEH